MNGNADRLVARGQWGTVEYAARMNGSMPAKDFYDLCSVPDKAKLNALFKWMADAGRISNRQKFRQVEGEIFEFKSFQIRISTYRNGNCWILLHGFTKKSDYWPAGELSHAKLVMAEDKIARKANSKGGRHG